MPIRSGFEVLDWIRSQPELDPLLVVVLTGSDLPADVVTADQLGTNSYLVKSSDYKQLTLFLKSFAPQ
jgi:CheY-like chemotaxis protein